MSGRMGTAGQHVTPRAACQIIRSCHFGNVCLEIPGPNLWPVGCESPADSCSWGQSHQSDLTIGDSTTSVLLFHTFWCRVSSDLPVSAFLEQESVLSNIRDKITKVKQIRILGELQLQKKTPECGSKVWKYSCCFSSCAHCSCWQFAAKSLRAGFL